MKVQIRQGVFETNSSSEHSISIRIGGCSFYREVDDWMYDVDILDEELDEVLQNLPLSRLESAIGKRKDKYRELIKEVPTELLKEELKNR